jgi:hypothetical protein
MRVYFPARHVQVQAILGVAFVQHVGWTQRFSSDRTPEGPRLRRPLPSDVGITMGLDARIGGEHLALVPSFRFWRLVACTD